MSEPELTPEIASQLFGAQPVDEPEPSEGEEGEIEGEPEPGDDDREHDAARAHNEFLAGLFRHRDEAKAKADAEFFRLPGMQVQPPDEGE